MTPPPPDATPPRLTRAVAAGDRWAGQDGTAYPVREGEVWAVGDHLFTCSDLMESRLLDAFADEAAATYPGPKLLYCDPPWGQGLVNSFRTKAGLGHASYRWEDLYRRIADLGHSRGMPVWLEGSVIESRDGRRILPAMIHPEHQVNHYWEIEYASHSPAGLYYASDRPYPAVLETALTGMHDRNTPGTVMAAYGPTGLVVDPSVGLGGTPANAHRKGWSSLSNELNPYRLSASLARLARLTGAEPRRLR